MSKMGYAEPGHAGTKAPQPMTPRDHGGDSSSSELKLASRSKRREFKEKQAVPRLRTSNACEACRTRKTKCSGPPGPCRMCKDRDSMCYFIARSDTRRKRAISSDATLERRGYILDAMFLMLKHCKGEDIQTLIQMIRNTAQPEELIRCIKANLQSLQDQGLVDIRQIDDHDLISVAPSILLKGWMREDQRPSDGSMKNSSPGVESVSTEPDGSCLQDEISTNIGFDHGATIFPDNTRGGVQEHVPTYDNPYDFFEALGIDDDDHSSCYLPPTTVARSVTGTSQTSSVTTTPLDTHHTFMTIDLPVRPPETALDQSTFAFIEYAHRLLSTGRTLAELNDHGIPSCELLFRERTTRDRITIPNWACETARHFPPNLLPTTRIALALSLMRVMPYLICQSLETWSTLPGMLHPTNLQQRVLHRIEYAFIPIPKLRECMIDHSTPTTTDWIAHLAAHSCHVAYPNHNNADVNDAIDGHVGAHNDIKIKPSSTTNTTPLTPDNMKETLILQNDSRYTDMVTRDLKTGQLYISPGFERACWTFENWSVSRGILGVWPDLNGHIKVD